MMIVGVGIDLIENKRFEGYLQDDRKIARILSLEEVEVFKSFACSKRKIEYLASRFCTKEAFIKASNSYNLHFNYTDISVLNNENGSPYLKFAFSFTDSVKLSLTHTDDYSSSIVIIEKQD